MEKVKRLRLRDLEKDYNQKHSKTSKSNVLPHHPLSDNESTNSLSELPEKLSAGFKLLTDQGNLDTISNGDMVLLNIPTTETLELGIPPARPLIAMINYISPDKSDISVKFCNSVAFKKKWFRANQGMVQNIIFSISWKHAKICNLQNISKYLGWKRQYNRTYFTSRIYSTRVIVCTGTSNSLAQYFLKSSAQNFYNIYHNTKSKNVQFTEWT